MRKHRILLKKLEDNSLLKNEFDLSQLLSNKYLNFGFEQFEKPLIKGRLRKALFKVLIEVHNNWLFELEKLNKPYYLAIWIKESELMLSEVVCGIDERIEFYENQYFDEPYKVLELNLEEFGTLKDDFKEFKWSSVPNFKSYDNVAYNFPKENYLNVNDYFKDKRFYKRVLPKCKKIEEGKHGKIFYREFGKVWIGQKSIR